MSVGYCGVGFVWLSVGCDGFCWGEWSCVSGVWVVVGGVRGAWGPGLFPVGVPPPVVGRSRGLCDEFCVEQAFVYHGGGDVCDLVEGVPKA